MAYGVLARRAILVYHKFTSSEPYTIINGWHPEVEMILKAIISTIFSQNCRKNTLIYL